MVLSAPRLAMIGNVPLASPFTLAALSGYSDLGMRLTCRSLGACLTRHEVILDQTVMQKRARGARGGMHLDPVDRPIVCQLMGNDPDEMANAAQRMVEVGYDVIDINFGCPVKKVLGRCRGGFLLGDPDTAIEMVAKVIDRISVPVTIKMRRGKDDTDESRDNFWRILERAVNLGVAGVAIHGRTVEQRYEGFAVWDMIGAAKQRFPELVVFGSGDLFTAEDCIRMLEETGCDGVTIARGAINNPWVFRDCLALWTGQPKPPPPTIQEQGELMDWQYRLCIEQYGVERASRQMRKFGIKRAHLHPLGAEVSLAFVSLSTTAEWEETRRRYYT